MPRNSTLAVLTIACTVASSVLIAQRGPVQDPLVRKTRPSSSRRIPMIPDNNVGLVPNILIVVGSRGTLVIDPGLGGGMVNGPARSERSARTRIVHQDHAPTPSTRPAVAFPSSARMHQLHRPEAEFEQGSMQMVQMFSGRSPATAEI